jgi:hypothetical protein
MHKQSRNPNIIIRRFNDPKIQEYGYLSSHFPEEMMYAFRKSENIYNNHFLIGPLYFDNKLQIGITGTIKQNETADPMVTMFREMGEEVGVYPKHPDASLELDITEELQTNSRKYTKRNFYVYEVNIQDCEKVSKIEDGKYINKEKDTVDRDKVGCFLFASYEEARQFLETKNIYRYFSLDRICGVGAVSVAYAKHFLKGMGKY